MCLWVEESLTRHATSAKSKVIWLVTAPSSRNSSNNIYKEKAIALATTVVNLATLAASVPSPASINERNEKTSATSAASQVIWPEIVDSQWPSVTPAARSDTLPASVTGWLEESSKSEN